MAFSIGPQLGAVTSPVATRAAPDGSHGTVARYLAGEEEDDKAGTFRRISIHGCRHTPATNMLKAAVPIHVVSQFLGRATAQITLDNHAWVLPGQDEAACHRARCSVLLSKWRRKW